MVPTRSSIVCGACLERVVLAVQPSVLRLAHASSRSPASPEQNRSEFRLDRRIRRLDHHVPPPASSWSGRGSRKSISRLATSSTGVTRAANKRPCVEEPHRHPAPWTTSVE